MQNGEDTCFKSPPIVYYVNNVLRDPRLEEDALPKPMQRMILLALCIHKHTHWHTQETWTSIAKVINTLTQMITFGCSNSKMPMRGQADDMARYCLVEFRVYSVEERFGLSNSTS